MITLLFAGCGGDDEPRTPAPSVNSCAGGWQVLFTHADGLEPASLAVTYDALLFRSFEGSVADFNAERTRIRSLSLDYGHLRTVAVAEALPEQLWVEDGTLLYSSGASLFSVPLDGGVPQLLLDGGGSVPLSHGFQTGLDAEHFYWQGEESSESGLTIWRRPRAGGETQVFASLPRYSDNSARVWLGAEGLLVADGRESSLLPLDASGAVPLALVPSAAFSLLGLDALGAYWLTGSGSSETEILRAPVTGGPLEPFWSDRPESVIPLKLWSDGRSGWLVSAQEMFDDGVYHRTAWRLNADESGRRVACDPREDSIGEVGDPVFTYPSAYQVIRQRLGPDPITWSIVELPSL